MPSKAFQPAQLSAGDRLKLSYTYIGPRTRSINHLKCELMTRREPGDALYFRVDSGSIRIESHTGEDPTPGVRNLQLSIERH